MTVTWLGLTSADWYDPANWSGAAVPTYSDAVVVTGSQAMTIDDSSPFYLGSASRCLSVNFTGYTGTLTLVTSGGSFQVFNGNVTLAAGMTIVTSPAFQFDIMGTTAFTSAGQTIGSLTTGLGSCNLTLADDMTLTDYLDCENTPTINLGANTLRINVTNSGNGAIFQESPTTWTWATGGKLVLSTVGAVEADFYIDAPADPWFPPIHVDAEPGGVVKLFADLDCESFTIDGGTWDANGFTVTEHPPVPTVDVVSPASGPTFGGTPITITGTLFDAVSGVTFGGADATDVVTVSDTQVTCLTPSHAYGAVDVVLTNGDGGEGTASNAYTYTLPDATLVGWWLCNEASGSVAHDTSGYGNNANLTNGAAFALGQQGYCLSLDGTNDYAVTGAPGQDISSALTIALWINRSSLGSPGGLVVKTNGSTWNYDLGISLSGNELFFYSDNLSPQTVQSSGEIAATAEWHHVAVTVAGGTVTFYIDGANAGTSSVTGSMTPGSGEDVYLGWEGPTTTSYFAGKMYDVRVYDVALSPAQIASIATSPGSSHRSMGIGIGMGLS